MRAVVPTSAAERRERPPETPGGAETILLVEDEAQVRRLAAAVLRQRGYEVLEAATGHEALRPALKVLFMSGCADDESFQAEGRGGRPAFLSKPFTPAALAWKVRELLDRR